ncbi:heat shock factor-binding protein 1-like [Petromyzon marinus]|uniref:heat shock factor-binding protein 1-like n=1 Tax=Petromyzon marinus TaxID=7757 RepID=UPI003F70AFD5
MSDAEPETVQDLKALVENIFQQIQDKLQGLSGQVIGRIDGLSGHVDDLERQVSDLMTRTRLEEFESHRREWPLR